MPSKEDRLIENQIHEEEIISENHFIETLCIFKNIFQRIGFIDCSNNE